MGRGRLQHVVSELRSFLRFLAVLGLVPSGLDTQIDTPRLYREERLPRALPWETVRALLRSVDRSTPVGLRDYAMLLLIATYGLRTSEVVGLTLEAIEWRAKRSTGAPVQDCRSAVAPADRCRRRQPHGVPAQRSPQRAVSRGLRPTSDSRRGVDAQRGYKRFSNLGAAKWPRDPFSWAPLPTPLVCRQPASPRRFAQDNRGRAWAPQSGKYLRLSPPFRRGSSRRGAWPAGIKHTEGAAMSHASSFASEISQSIARFVALKKRWAGSTPWRAPS